eukprot:SAG11_NODE_1286_length_5299_cov_18.976923_6_plen_118_part_00
MALRPASGAVTEVNDKTSIRMPCTECTGDTGTQHRAPMCTVKTEDYRARTRTEFVESPGHAAPMCTALAGNRKTQYRAPRETGMRTAANGVRRADSARCVREFDTVGCWRSGSVAGV